MPFLSITGSTVYGWLWQVNGNNAALGDGELNAWHMLDDHLRSDGRRLEIFYVDGAHVVVGHRHLLALGHDRLPHHPDQRRQADAA